MRIFACIGLLVAYVSVSAQQPKYDDAVKKMKSLIAEHYIIREKVKALSDSLGLFSYKNLKPQDFVDKINIQLQRHAKDKHLRLEYNPGYASKVNNNSDPKEDQRANERKTNFGFNKVEILEGSIGMLKVTYFADPEGLDDLIKSVFTMVSNTDQLIIDLRGNSGGSGGMLQRLMSVFLAERSTGVLNVEYKTNAIQLKTDSIPLATYNKPVYLLCDRNTFSAGEGFAMVLQNRKRATIVGEPTAGAGNISGPYVVDDNFVITIPVGIIKDVMTGKGWEGRGVIPDVQVKSSEALAKALEVIRKKP